MDDGLTILKSKFIDYKVNVEYMGAVEESLRKERAEAEFNKLLEEIKHPDFRRSGGWEEFIPGWLEKAWPFLNEKAKIILYVMAQKCKNSHDEGREEAFNECGN